MAVIIGLDPGSQRTGIGVVEWDPRIPENMNILECSVLELGRGPIASRLAKLAQQLERCFDINPPEAVAVETAFLGKNVGSAFVLGQARGVCLAMAGRYTSEVAEYAPRTIKKLLTGSGAADKRQVQSFLQQIYGIRESSLDACDALALAICHAQQVRLKHRLAEVGGI